MLVLTAAFMIPVVGSVNIARMKVLSLFIDIPHHHVVALGNKCEKFLNSYHEENNDEIDSDDGNMKIDDSDVTTLGGGRRNASRMVKISGRSNVKFFV